MQTIHHARVDEGGNRAGAAFDQEAPEPARGKRRDDRRGRNLAVARGQDNDFDACGRNPWFRADENARGAVVFQPTAGAVETPLWVNDNSGRAAP